MAETKQTGREERQAVIDRRVSSLRQRAEAKKDEAGRLSGTINSDHAFWTQPAYGNAAGRAFAARRDRERCKLIKAGQLATEAREIEAKANAMASRGAVMAGDAAARRAEVIAALDVKPGDIVQTVHYGPRRVLKVNRKTLSVEGAFGPLNVCKSFCALATGGA